MLLSTPGHSRGGGGVAAFLLRLVGKVLENGGEPLHEYPARPGGAGAALVLPAGKVFTVIFR
jgi:hypothetical protein